MTITAGTFGAWGQIIGMRLTKRLVSPLMRLRLFDDVTLVQVATLATILCIGIFIQSAAGFAAGLIIVPLLLYAGFSIPQAQCALLVATIPQNLLGTWSLRDDIPRGGLWWPAIGRLAFLPLGVAVLRSCQSVSPHTLRQCVGGFVLAATLAMVAFHPRPRESLPALWAWLAFPLSGFCHGLVGMGGPMMVLWVQAHDWSTTKSRGFLFAMYTISLIPAIVIISYTFGSTVIEPSIVAGLSIPLLWPVTKAGLRVGTMLGRQRLRTVTIGLLILVGIAGLAAPYLSSR